ncbi:hypothetical protein B0H16DRAFT_1455121 [Mycena metata]|uniref:Uncharacterized protein n=1 Tax=Mycena metata TaxID=1033252 RepID=A0AAD7JFY6_9AGAR|nr:hypothetical protein B0H16DRAFT_1455121 [Mycena metata]
MVASAAARRCGHRERTAGATLLWRARTRGRRKDAERSVANGGGKGQRSVTSARTDDGAVADADDGKDVRKRVCFWCFSVRVLPSRLLLCGAERPVPVPSPIPEGVWRVDFGVIDSSRCSRSWSIAERGEEEGESVDRHARINPESKQRNAAAARGVPNEGVRVQRSVTSETYVEARIDVCRGEYEGEDGARRWAGWRRREGYGVAVPPCLANTGGPKFGNVRPGLPFTTTSTIATSCAHHPSGLVTVFALYSLLEVPG